MTKPTTKRTKADSLPALPAERSTLARQLGRMQAHWENEKEILMAKHERQLEKAIAENRELFDLVMLWRSRAHEQREWRVELEAKLQEWLEEAHRLRRPDA